MNMHQVISKTMLYKASESWRRRQFVCASLHVYYIFKFRNDAATQGSLGVFHGLEIVVTLNCSFN
jgi:hypothetical protein